MPGTLIYTFFWHITIGISALIWPKEYDHRILSYQPLADDLTTFRSVSAKGLYHKLLPHCWGSSFDPRVTPVECLC